MSRIDRDEEWMPGTTSSKRTRKSTTHDLCLSKREPASAPHPNLGWLSAAHLVVTSLIAERMRRMNDRN